MGHLQLSDMGVVWDRIISQFIEIIEWLDDDHRVLVWRFPVRAQEIKNNAKLIVREGQAAVFVNEGQVADVFGPGTYTLSTQNLPILATLKGWKYGFDSPFKAEVYFVATTQFVDIKWGTQNPVIVRDPEFGVVRLRAFGVFTLRAGDPAKLLREITGTDASFDVDEVIGQLKSALVSRFSQALATAQISIPDLAGSYELLGEKVFPIVQRDFRELGLEIPKFVIENVSLPPAVERVLDHRSEMALVGNLSQYSAYQLASAIPDAARTPNSLAGAGVGMAAGWQMGNQMMSGMPGIYGYPAVMPVGPGLTVPPGATGPAGETQYPRPSTAPVPRGTVEERLARLKALLESEHISRDAYQKRVEEILSEV
jgi:membrane protease subunit (stomatin/prohibitin family)